MSYFDYSPDPLAGDFERILERLKQQDYSQATCHLVVVFVPDEVVLNDESIAEIADCVVASYPELQKDGKEIETTVLPTSSAWEYYKTDAGRAVARQSVITAAVVGFVDEFGLAQFCTLQSRFGINRVFRCDIGVFIQGGTGDGTDSGTLSECD